MPAVTTTPVFFADDLKRFQSERRTASGADPPAGAREVANGPADFASERARRSLLAERAAGAAANATRAAAVRARSTTIGATTAAARRPRKRDH